MAKEPSRACGALNAEGEPCGAWAEKGSDPPRCFLHGADGENAKRAGTKGGYVRGARWTWDGPLETPQDRERFRIEALGALARGELDGDRAKVIGTVIGQLAPESKQSVGAALPAWSDQAAVHAWLEALAHEGRVPFWKAVFLEIAKDAANSAQGEDWLAFIFAVARPGQGGPPPLGPPHFCQTLEYQARDASEDDAWKTAQAWALRFKWQAQDDGAASLSTKSQDETTGGQKT